MLIIREKTRGCVSFFLFFLLAQLLLVSHYRSAGFHFKNNWNPCQGWRLHNANKPDLNVHLVRSHRDITQFNGITPSYTWGGKKMSSNACYLLLFYIFLLHRWALLSYSSGAKCCVNALKDLSSPALCSVTAALAEPLHCSWVLAALWSLCFFFYVNPSDTDIALWHSPHFPRISEPRLSSLTPSGHFFAAFHRLVYFKTTFLVKKKFVDRATKTRKRRKKKISLSIFCCGEQNTRSGSWLIMKQWQMLHQIVFSSRKGREVANRQISASYVACHAGR